jgi:hypothetical protein
MPGSKGTGVCGAMPEDQSVRAPIPQPLKVAAFESLVLQLLAVQQ